MVSGWAAASMKVAYGDQAQAGVVAVLGAAQEVAAQVTVSVARAAGALLGGEVAVGDLGGGEGEDALDDGEVGLVREVGAGGVQVGGGRPVRRRGPCRGRRSRRRRG